MQCEEVPLGEVVDQVATPFYLYSYSEIVRRFKKFRKSLLDYDGLVCYALKANSSKAIVSLLSGQEAGADVVSKGELYRALKAGIPPKKIVFAGVGKTEEGIRYALRNEILGLNVESLAELDTIEEAAAALSTTAPVAIRVLPDIASSTHPYLSTGERSSKFGIARDRAVRAYRRIAESELLESVGVHAHIGSQIRTIDPYRKLGKFLGDLLEEIKEVGARLQYVDFGGGFGILERKNDYEMVPSPGEFIEALLNGFGPAADDYQLLIEPGRSIIGPSGVLVGRVVRRKQSKEKNFLITDIGMNDFIRPSLYGSYHQLEPVLDHEAGGEEEIVDIVGPVCETGDFIARDRKMPPLKEGDSFLVRDSGAYGRSMASNYNSRPRPSEVMVREGEFEIVRERETLEDLVEGERLPAFIQDNEN